MPKVDPKTRTSSKETPHEGFASICSILAIGLFALTFIFQNFLIPSSSMASTLLVGDHVMVEREILAPPTHGLNLLPYRDIKRGDVIVFYKPVAEEAGAEKGQHIPLVKRVVAVPGDRIHLRNGILYRNGVAQNEPQMAKPTYANYDSYVDDFPLIAPGDHPGVLPEWAASLPEFLQGDDLVVPPGKYFAMGDNRTNSLDSRYWGFVSRENIIGRPLFVYWSIRMPESGVDEAPLSERAASTAHEFLHFFDDTRWSRTFHRIQ
jgi:signal peptidase I